MNFLLNIDVLKETFSSRKQAVLILIFD
jgi:hypothetical protein